MFRMRGFAHVRQMATSQSVQYSTRDSTQFHLGAPMIFGRKAVRATFCWMSSPDSHRECLSFAWQIVSDSSREHRECVEVQTHTHRPPAVLFVLYVQYVESALRERRATGSKQGSRDGSAVRRVRWTQATVGQEQGWGLGKWSLALAQLHGQDDSKLCLELHLWFLRKVRRLRISLLSIILE